MNIKNGSKKGVVTAMVALSMIAGSLGGSLLSGHPANAQTVTPAKTTVTPATTGNSGSTNQPTVDPSTSGTFHSNENAAHEATESPAREAQENAGQRPTVQ